MKTAKFKIILSNVICLVLIAAMALSMTACSNASDESPASGAASAVSSVSAESSEAQSSAQDSTVSEVGEGDKSFTFVCTDSEGAQKKFAVKTNESTVGAALLENGLIDGENGAYGLYVKTVCGITADYDTDGTYWAFYIDGEYAMTGVDSTEIKDGSEYEFKIEK